MTWRVGVVVPARDEEGRIGPCLEAVAAAVQRAGRPAVVVRRRRPLPRRDRGTGPRRGRRRRWSTAARSPSATSATSASGASSGGWAAVTERTWLLGTDADTIVPRPGSPTTCATRGRARSPSPAPSTSTTRTCCPPTRWPATPRLVAARVAGRTHGHAYAANLGVRGRRVPAGRRLPGRHRGEEHALLARLRHAGHRVLSPTDVRARTSARTTGRARGGLADLLCALT